MSAGTCSTCKHWETRHEARRNPLYVDEAVPVDDRPRWGWCDLIGLPEYGEVVTITAYVRDGSDYAADLNTRDDFGCTLHEPTPTPENPA